MNVPRLTAQVINGVIDLIGSTNFTPAPWPPEPEPDAVSEPVDLSWRDTPWATADGQRQRIRELTDGHLRNIIFYLHRDTGFKLNTDGFSEHEIIDYNGVWDRRCALYDLMLREAEYRNLGWR